MRDDLDTIPIPASGGAAFETTFVEPNYFSQAVHILSELETRGLTTQAIDRTIIELIKLRMETADGRLDQILWSEATQAIADKFREQMKDRVPLGVGKDVSVAVFPYTQTPLESA